MPRIRTIKPELAKHEGLFDLEHEVGLPVRFVWALLPCFCDREGRFQWRPRRLGVDILPYDGIDMSRVLDALLTRGFIAKYRVDDEWFGMIPTFAKHQVVNNREAASEIPSIDGAEEVVYHGNHAISLENGEVLQLDSTREARVDDACSTALDPALGEGKGREGNGKEGNKECPSAKRGHVYDPKFEEFWSAFPRTRRTKKQEAYRKWKLTVKRVDADWLTTRAREYAESPRGRSEYAVMPSVWLNSGMWDDEPEAWELSDSKKPFGNGIKVVDD